MSAPIKCKLSLTHTKINHFFVENKLQCIIALIVLIAAFLLSIWNTIANFDTLETTNIVVLISLGEYSIFSFIVGLIVFDLIFAALLIISITNIYLLWGGYICLFIASYSYIKGYIFSLFADGFIGVLSFILYFLPLLFIAYCSYNYSLIKLTDLTGVTTNCKRFINFGYYKSTIFKKVAKTVLINTVLIIVFSMLAFLILSISN